MMGHFQKIIILVTMILLSNPVAAQNQSPQPIFDNFESESALKYVPMLSSDDPGIREQAVKNIHSAGRDIQEIVPQVLSLLNDPRPDVQIAALKVLAQINDKSLPKYITLKLESDNKEVRYVAAVALAKHNIKIALPVILEFINDPEVGKRIWAVEQLKIFNYKESIPNLIELLKVEQSTSVIRSIGDTLLWFKGYQVDRLLAELLDDDNERAQQNAAHLLAQSYPAIEQGTVAEARAWWQENKAKGPWKVVSPQDSAGKTKEVFRNGVSQSIDYDDSGKVKRVQSSDSSSGHYLLKETQYDDQGNIRCVKTERNILGHYFFGDSQWTLIIIILVFLVGPIVYLIKSGEKKGKN